MTAPGRPACPPWCSASHDDGLLSCSSSASLIHLKNGSVTAYARRSNALGEHITVAGKRWLHVTEAEDARELAGLVDLLAGATPEQHRDLAAQIRIAAAALGWEEDADGRA